MRKTSMIRLVACGVVLRGAMVTASAQSGGSCGTWTTEAPILPPDVFSAGWSGVTVIAPADHLQAGNALRAAVNLAGPVYFRLGKDDSFPRGSVFLCLVERGC